VGTSSIIGRPTPQGWEGRLCSYEGHPERQGRVLFEAVTGHFAGDVDAARGYFLDDHPAGWSHLGGDFTKPTGYLTRGRGYDHRNQCLCHGDRHDPPGSLITHRDQLPWTDYGYLLGDDHLTMLVAAHTPVGVRRDRLGSHTRLGRPRRPPAPRHQPPAPPALATPGWWHASRPDPVGRPHPAPSASVQGSRPPASASL